MTIGSAGEGGGPPRSSWTCVGALLALLTLLLLGRVGWRLVSKRGLARVATQSRRLRRRNVLALVLVGVAPAGADHRLTHLLQLCRWPASVTCYSASGTDVQPIEALAASRCHVALLVPWDVDLLPEWDLRALLACEGQDVSQHVLSFTVPHCARVEQWRAPAAGQPPQLVSPARSQALAIPDFRFMLSSPVHLARVAEFWFASFFAGLLAYPVPTLDLLSTAGGREPLAVDPVDRAAQATALTASERTTLVAGGVTSGLHPDLWPLLFQEPVPWVRVPGAQVSTT